jgi:hypothetical protein
MHKARELGEFKGVCVGNSELEVSHLQFDDDTLILGEASIQNVQATRAIQMLNFLLFLKQISISVSLLHAILVMVGWILRLMSYNVNQKCFLSPMLVFQ